MSAPNPYQTPNEVKTVPEKSRTGRNIRAICILYIVFGAVAVLAGIGFLVDPKGADVPPAVGWAVLFGGSFGVISAIGVLCKKMWGIPVCQVVSALYVLGFPVGTILGGYFLLNIGKVKSEFRSPNRDQKR